MSSTLEPLLCTAIWGADIGTERFENNRATAEDKGLDWCVLCGKGVAHGKGYWVTVLEGHGGTYLAPNHIDTEDDVDPNHWSFMGAHPVGPDCGRKLPADYRLQRHPDNS